MRRGDRRLGESLARLVRHYEYATRRYCSVTDPHLDFCVLRIRIGNLCKLFVDKVASYSLPHPCRKKAERNFGVCVVVGRAAGSSFAGRCPKYDGSIRSV